MIYWIIAGWLCCAVLSAGIYFAHFQEKFPTIAKQQYRQDLAMAWMWGLFFAPMSLVLGIFLSGFLQHGWWNFKRK